MKMTSAREVWWEPGLNRILENLTTQRGERVLDRSSESVVLDNAAADGGGMDMRVALHFPRHGEAKASVNPCWE